MTDHDRLLGKLLAEAETSQRQRAELFEQLREIRTNMVHKEDFCRHVEETEDALTDYKATKAKVTGMVVVFSALAAGIWEIGKTLL